MQAWHTRLTHCVEHVDTTQRSAGSDRTRLRKSTRLCTRASATHRKRSKQTETTRSDEKRRREQMWKALTSYKTALPSPSLVLGKHSALN